MKNCQNQSGKIKIELPLVFSFQNDLLLGHASIESSLKVNSFFSFTTIKVSFIIHTLIVGSIAQGQTLER